MNQKTVVLRLCILFIGLVLNCACASATPAIAPTTDLVLPTACCQTEPPADAPASATLIPSDTPSPVRPTATLTKAVTPTLATNDSIVWVCQIFKDGERDQLCLMDSSGGNPRRLTDNDDADYNYPTFSPDRQSILYASTEAGSFEIFEMDLMSGESWQLTDGPGDAYAPDVSLDNQSIIYVNKIGGSEQVWIMNRDGSQPQMIIGFPGNKAIDPVWSPDGENILFASNFEGETQLFSFNLVESLGEPITYLSGLRGRSDWSMDGKNIATYAGPSWKHEIFILPWPNLEPVQITTEGNNLAPSFSPDGEWIVFTSYKDNYGDNNGCEIYKMKIDGTELTRLTENDYCDWQPRWGP